MGDRKILKPPHRLTADKKEIPVYPCPTAAWRDRQEKFPQIAFGNFFYPPNVI